MLLLPIKAGQKIILKDTVSGTVVTIKSLFRRKRGDLALVFDAPKTVEITRERNERQEEN